ncbi:ABC transporter substrate-binding protein [Streptomyces purpurogeneiscleroticus]|uniref:ABC transporter substrate-binding protein n=1 Tax=Streptomyces purpurogeneiscleroticus TaxID=68259 RepID=UPI001CBDC527|nr:ABC transporter substrate-binding protein [Streptomyces purpurogeneiscleroticus]MBZ4016644.1 sugar ABC transporter substrate-binding protein [Streptomyces purpurogeneiscleroticus]
MRHATLRTATALVAVGALALTGCGGDSGSRNDEGGGGTDSAPTVRLPKLNGQTLQVTAVWTGPERENFTKVLDEFEKRTGAKIDFVPSGDDMAGFIGSKVAGGGAPDVAMLQQVGVLQEFAKKGWLKPLGPAAEKELGKNFSKGWQELGSYNGKRYGVYFKASNKSLVWYNTQAFENAGVSEPKDWKGFLKTARTLADSGVEPVSVGGADGWTLTDWFENIYLSQAGPEKYDQLAKHEIKWTDPSVKQALTTLGSLFGAKGLLAGGNSGALQTAFPQSVTQTFKDEPQAAMVSSADFAAANIGQTKAKIGTDAKVFPFPAVGKESPVVTGGDVAVALKDNKASQALLTFLASPDAARIWAGQGGFVSANKKLDPAVYPNAVFREIGKALVAAGDDFRFDMSDQAPASFGGKPGQGEWKALQDFLKNPKDVAGTQAQLEKDAAKSFGN